MFYCGPCATERDWPNADYLPTSYGACEICKYPARCFDVPSRHLPDMGEQEAIKSIKQTIEKRSL